MRRGWRWFIIGGLLLVLSGAGACLFRGNDAVRAAGPPTKIPRIIAGHYVMIYPFSGMDEDYFFLIQGVVDRGLPSGGSLSDLFVYVDFYHNPPPSEDVWVLALEPYWSLVVRQGQNSAEFALWNPGILRPNDVPKRTGTITVDATCLNSTIPEIRLQEYYYSQFIIDFEGIQVDNGAATWEGGRAAVSIRFRLVPEP